MHSDRKKLWEPSNEWINGAEVTRFVDFVNKKFNQKINGGTELYRWSVENIQDFWEAMWEFGGIIASQTYSSVVDDLKKFPGCKFFPGAKLNLKESNIKEIMFCKKKFRNI